MSWVPETQQSQQAVEVEELVVGVEDLLEMSATEQGDSALETQQDSDSNDDDIADTLDTQAAGRTQKGKGKGKCKGKGKGIMYQKRRLTKEARNPLFCSVLRRRNYWTFCMTMKFSTTSV